MVCKLFWDRVVKREREKERAKICPHNTLRLQLIEIKKVTFSCKKYQRVTSILRGIMEDSMRR